jgi:hypothetical protein
MLFFSSLPRPPDSLPTTFYSMRFLALSTETNQRNGEAGHSPPSIHCRGYGCPDFTCPPSLVGIRFSGKMKTTGWTHGEGKENISEFCKTCLCLERVQLYLMEPSVVKFNWQLSVTCSSCCGVNHLSLKSNCCSQSGVEWLPSFLRVSVAVTGCNWQKHKTVNCIP